MPVRRGDESADRHRLSSHLNCGRILQMPTRLAEQVCVCWLKHSELRWPPSKDVFALVECAMAMTLPARHRMNSNLQPVDFARYYSVLIRKPLSCVIGHNNARY